MSAIESWHVTRTFQCIELLAERPRSAPQIADVIGVHPRTARRVLKRLAEQGYVERNDADARYSLTMRIVALAAQVLARGELAHKAIPYVRQLRKMSGLPAHLLVPSGRSVLSVIDDISGSGPAPEPRLGDLLPAHASAPGKVLLAHRPAWGTAVIGQPVERHTATTIVARVEMELELQAVRERGYAVERSEYRDDRIGIAAAVFGQSGEAIAALGIAGTVDELSEERTARHAALVIGTASSLSAALGAERLSPGHHTTDLVPEAPAQQRQAIGQL